MAASQPLSPLDWLMPRSYIRQLLFFRAPPPAFADRLQAGLAGAVADMPHLLGTVVEHADPPGSVALRRPASPDDAAALLFSRQDLSDALDDYDALRGRHFPPAALRAAHAPPPRLPPLDPTAAEERGPAAAAPVFRARLTRVRGGAVLAVAVHHTTADVTGLGALLAVWAAHCRTGSAAAVGFGPAWCDRAPLCVAPPPPEPEPEPAGPSPPPRRRVPELLFFEDADDDGDDDEDDVGTTPRATVPRRFAVAPDTPFAAGLFAFAAPRLRALRDNIIALLSREATSTRETPPPWVSTADVLTAVLWSAVVAALHGDEEEAAAAAGADAEISVPVNFRTRGDVPLPAGYLGAAFGRARVRVPVRRLGEVVRVFGQEGGGYGGGKELESPPPTSALAHALAPVALAIRHAITGALAGPAPVASAMGFVAGQPDVAALPRRPARAMSFVSWADEGVCALAWDDDGTRCERVRVPGPPAGRNYLIVLPRLPDGALEVLVCLEREAMGRFGEGGGLVAGLGEVRWVDEGV